MQADGWIALAILAGAIAAFASNRFRVDAVGLGVLLALAVTQLITTSEALAGFSDTSVVMIAGLFVVGEGLVTTGVAAALGSWLARVGGGSEVRLLVMLMIVVASIGAFMSSTGIVAIFIPVVLHLVAKTGFRRSRLMMPLSVAALISGLMSLIATAPNLVVSSELAQQGYGPLGFFELTPIGVAILACAIVYMVTVGRRLLDKPEATPDRRVISQQELLDSYGVSGRFAAARIEPQSALDGQTVGEARLRSRYGVTLIAVGRPEGKGYRVIPATAETVLRAGDLVGLAAEPGALQNFTAAERLQAVEFHEEMRALAREHIGVAEVMLAPDAPIIGKTVREAEFRKRRGLTIMSIKRKGQVIDDDLSDLPLKFGDLILVAGGWPLIAKLHEHVDEFVVLRLPQELQSIAPARHRMPVALAILLTMIVVMTFGLLANAVAILLAALAMVAFGCVSAKGVYKSIGWSTVVLIAGMLPLATALYKTGVTDVMSVGLTNLLQSIGPYAMLAALFLITATASLFISNTATAVLIAPVAIGAAEALNVSPHAFAVTVAVAASCAFVTPVSSPVNTLVLEPGGYSFGDFVKVGVPLLLISLVVTVIMVGLLYPVGTPRG